MKLSKYFTFEEFFYSDNAKKYKIDNKPNLEESINLVRLHDNCMVKIREKFKSPVIISSGYRNEKVNKLAGGKSNSQHRFGMACDFVVKNHSNNEVFDWSKKNLEYDQIILEKVNNVEWVHISFNFGKNRKETLAFDGKKYTVV